MDILSSAQSAVTLAENGLGVPAWKPPSLLLVGRLGHSSRCSPRLPEVDHPAMLKTPKNVLQTNLFSRIVELSTCLKENRKKGRTGRSHLFEKCFAQCRKTQPHELLHHTSPKYSSLPLFAGISLKERTHSKYVTCTAGFKQGESWGHPPLHPE